MSADSFPVGGNRRYGVIFSGNQADFDTAAFAAYLLPPFKENAGCVRRGKRVASEKAAFIAEVEQPQQSRGNIYLADRHGQLLCFYELRGIKEQRNAVVFRRTVGNVRFFGSAVGHKDKYGIVEP